MNVLIFAILAGFFNALMDTIEFHWGRCWIFNWLWKHWQKAYWWFYSQWMPNHDKWTHWIFGDGWHTAKIFMLVSISGALYFSAGNWLAVIYFVLGWGVSFNLFFHVIFVLPIGGDKIEKKDDGLFWGQR